jgi:hypothetical protein
MSLMMQPNYNFQYLRNRARAGEDVDYTSLYGDTTWYPRWNFPSYQSQYMGDEETYDNRAFPGGMCTCRSRAFNYGVKCNCFKFKDLAQAARQGPINAIIGGQQTGLRRPVPITWRN